MKDRTASIRQMIIDYIAENGPIKEHKLYTLFDYPWTTIRYNIRMMRYEASAEIDRQIRHFEKSGGKIQRIKFGVVTRDSVVHLAK